MKNKSVSAALKKNAMLIVLVLVYLFFLILTKGGIFSPSSFTELINQNAYVYILGAGMLMCMLTGGNIDLSCGAFVCLLGALGGVFMIVLRRGPGLPDRLRSYSPVDRDAGGLSGLPRPGPLHPFGQLRHRISGAFPDGFPEHLLRPDLPDGEGRFQLALLPPGPAGRGCGRGADLQKQTGPAEKGL